MQVRKSILITLIIAACLASYFNTLFADFVYDDNIFITPNPYMKSFRYLPQFFIQDFCYVGIEKLVSHYYRPFLAASYMLDFTIWKGDPFGYHLTNLIFHTLASILVFLLVELLIKNGFISFYSALLFSVHPVHTGAVSFISGRVDVIPPAFLLLSLVLFLKYVFDKKIIFYMFSLVSFSVALLTKEMVVTLPVIVICIDYFFLSQCNLSKVINNFLRFHLGFLVVLGIYMLMRFQVIGKFFLPEASLQGINFFPGTHHFWRLFTAIKILTIYIRLLFFPYELNAEYFLLASNSLFEPIVLIGLAIILSLCCIAFKYAKKTPILSFSIFWFFITILPVSNIFPQGNIFAERYVYIPSVGFCIAIGFLFSSFLKKNIKTHSLNWQKSLSILFFLLIIALGRVTYERNKVWEDDFSLWHETVKASPYSPVAHANLASVYYNLNLWDKAIEEANMTIKLDPLFYQAFFVLGNAYLKKGETEEAIEAYKKAIEIVPNSDMAYNRLAIAYGKNGQYKKAIKAGLTALEMNPYCDWARYNLAVNYSFLGLVDEAVDSYEKYLETNPDFPGVYVDLGYLYYKKGDYKKAREKWFAALKLSEDFQPAKKALMLLKD